MSDNKKYKWNIGTFEGSSKRERPSMSKVDSFLKDMKKDFSDYDVYLWGSWPERHQTWDVDFLLNNPSYQFDTKEMEQLVHNSLKKGLIQRNFMPDIGFAQSPNSIKNFGEVVDRYRKTGIMNNTQGLIYGDKWFADDKLFKDRTRITEASIEPIENNFLSVRSTIPYPKMKSRARDFDKYYRKKPLLISNRKKIYGI
jgi:hypothetical protein